MKLSAAAHQVGEFVQRGEATLHQGEAGGVGLDREDARQGGAFDQRAEDRPETGAQAMGPRRGPVAGARRLPEKPLEEGLLGSEEALLTTLEVCVEDIAVDPRVVDDPLDRQAGIAVLGRRSGDGSNQPLALAVGPLRSIAWVWLRGAARHVGAAG